VNKLIISPTVKTTIKNAGDIFLESYEQSIQKRGYFSIVLSGGHTPKPLYEHLSRMDEIRWDKVHIFWGDERHVPPDHHDSNYRLAYNALLSKITIPKENIFRIKGELSPEITAEDYQKTLNRYFDTHEKKFDLVILGMGVDGHTASLFPGTDAFLETTHWVVANFVPKLDAWRITLTFPAILSARKIVVLIIGDEKAETLKEVLEGDEDNNNFPIKRILSTNNDIVWIVDHQAGRLLSARNK
jgi:6-phosphogluconolactonase